MPGYEELAGYLEPHHFLTHQTAWKFQALLFQMASQLPVEAESLREVAHMSKLSRFRPTLTIDDKKDLRFGLANETLNQLLLQIHMLPYFRRNDSLQIHK